MAQSKNPSSQSFIQIPLNQSSSTNLKVPLEFKKTGGGPAHPGMGGGMYVSGSNTSLKGGPHGGSFSTNNGQHNKSVSILNHSCGNLLHDIGGAGAAGNTH